MTNSTIRDNFVSCTSGLICSAHGAGIYNNGALTVVNSTFSGNSASCVRGCIAFGGAVYNAGTLNVTNSTFSGNSASSAGGGLFNAGTATLQNTIIGNSPFGGDCTNGGTLTGNHTLIKDGTSACGLTNGTNGNLVGVDPKLLALANNGGPTPTMALGADSPAIDAGADAVCASAPIGGQDQRGVSRPQGPHCDIGAYERNISSQTGPNFVVNSNADSDDGFCDSLGLGIGNKDCTLREAISAANARSGADTITFNIPPSDGGCAAANHCTITLTVGTLPAISDDLTMDGTGQSITVSGNHAVRVLAVNGGTHVSLNRLTLANGFCANCNGGGIYNAGTLTVTNSTLSANSASACTGLGCVVFGGAIYNAGTLSVTNSTLSENNAICPGSCNATGGGIYNAGTLSVTNSTFSHNNATNPGGGIYNAGTATLRSSIIEDSLGGDCASSGTLTSSYNLIEDAATACGLTNGTDGNLIGIESGVGPPADNGGPTLTNALAPGSPAIGWIPLGTNGCGTTITSDQRGAGRPLGYRQGVPACSIGSYEVGELFLPLIRR